jgi:uncharacterized membrane-anchored protein YhcB (DUF1043 family)
MYIDTGTFWVIAIGLGIAVGVIYYLLNDKIKKNQQDIQSLLKAIRGMADFVDQEFVNVRNENHRANAEIYGNVADALDELDAKTKKLAKKK